jgi:hypothetical protein
MNIHPLCLGRKAAPNATPGFNPLQELRRPSYRPYSISDSSSQFDPSDAEAVNNNSGSLRPRFEQRSRWPDGSQPPLTPGGNSQAQASKWTTGTYPTPPAQPRFSTVAAATPFPPPQSNPYAPSGKIPPPQPPQSSSPPLAYQRIRPVTASTWGGPTPTPADVSQKPKQMPVGPSGIQAPVPSWQQPGGPKDPFLEKIKYDDSAVDRTFITLVRHTQCICDRG